ncbi:heme/hemin ABC transporter substrate-binding protein [Marinimicrobium sp. ARAG 43.8]|uniref:heme/hemin ABC transporter substrate-binding protein n=1 Tax=Marinimicrobium sp. ARAG 43.8 TaxID=3418719 RepID=UPI003CF63421
MHWLRIGFLMVLMTVTSAYAADRPTLVSVGGGVTEIVYALGAEDQLLGVDTSSTWPEAATELPQVGYQRTLSAEGVLSLRPQVLLASHEAGPPHVLTQLADAGVDVVRVEGDYSFAGLLNRVETVAEAIGRETQGKALAEQLQSEWQAVQTTVKNQSLQAEDGGALRVVVLMSHAGTPMAAGEHSGADTMLSMAGVRNAFAEQFQGYKPFSAEAMVSAAPDAIVVTRIDSSAFDIDRVIEDVPGLSLAPAGKNRRVIPVDIVRFLGFGPRLPEAVAELHKALGLQSEH